MHKRFDISIKQVVEAYPADFVRLCGITPRGRVRVVNSELSSLLVRASDEVIRVEGPGGGIVAHEVQSSYAADLPQRMQVLDALLRQRHRLPVDNFAILLTRRADGPAMTGKLEQPGLHGRPGMPFTYGVIRVWELPAEQVLTGGLGLLPLAVLTDEASERMPKVIRAMSKRLRRISHDECSIIWAASYILSGLRYDESISRKMFRGVQDMKESSTYQGILREGIELGREKGREEGREEGKEDTLRATILKVAMRNLDQPPPGILSKIKATHSIVDLELMLDRALDAKSWRAIVGTTNRK